MGPNIFYLPLPNKYLECGYKGLVFVEIDDGWMIKNIDSKWLTVPKWVLIVWPKMPQNSSAQFVCPSPKVLDFNAKRLHWTPLVRVVFQEILLTKMHKRSQNVMGNQTCDNNIILAPFFLDNWVTISDEIH